MSEVKALIQEINALANWMYKLDVTSINRPKLNLLIQSKRNRLQKLCAHLQWFTVSSNNIFSAETALYKCKNCGKSSNTRAYY